MRKEVVGARGRESFFLFSTKRIKLLFNLYLLLQYEHQWTSATILNKGKYGNMETAPGLRK